MGHAIDHTPDYTGNSRASQLPVREKISDLTYGTETDQTASQQTLLGKSWRPISNTKGVRVTDDTAACELIGQQVRLVENAGINPKVTLPSDLAYIELLLRSDQTG